MFPFCRGHSETDTVDHEPWSFGEEVCINCKFYTNSSECFKELESTEASFKVDGF